MEEILSRSFLAPVASELRRSGGIGIDFHLLAIMMLSITFFGLLIKGVASGYQFWSQEQNGWGWRRRSDIGDSSQFAEKVDSATEQVFSRGNPDLEI